MSKCQLYIETDRHDRVYQVGDSIDCTVRVVVNKKVKCNNLLVRKNWYTHGRGNSATGGDIEHSLFKGEWQPGEYEYDCSFDIESGPLTYHGHYINIDWQLTVEADIPWVFDPKESIDFIVERGPSNDSQDSVLETEPESSSFNTSQFGPIAYLFPLIFIVIGVSIAVFGWVSVGFIELVVGVVFFAAGLLIAYKMIQNTLAQSKIGQVDLTIKPATLRPNQEAELSISFTPKSTIDLNHITTRLVGEERAVSGSGTNRTTHRHVLHQQDHPIMDQCKINAGSLINHQIQITIPPDAPPSFSADDNRIQWQLEFTIDIDNWPDWVHNRTLKVVM